MRPHRSLASVIVLFLVGCATTLVALQLDDRFGPADPARFDAPPAPRGDAPDYWSAVRPVLDGRCVACHACYDAPCQLNLASYAGLTRGADPRPVYSSSRLIADPPTRLGFDALSNAEWRRKGFFPVLNERENAPEANREGGVLYRMLELKRTHPGPELGPLADRDLDFSLDRDQTCVRAEGFDHYARSHPTRGMPFGLPPVSRAEHDTLARWLEAGAPYTPLPPLPAVAQARVDEWEAFLNADSLKMQLVARYIYEHWFAGHLHFDEAPGRYFELVRSRTPPGVPIDVIATVRPYDDPGVARVFYRLRFNESTPAAKTFMPLKLDAGRLQRVKSMFLQPAYEVKALPGYAPEVASNPFRSFSALPVDARYRFMLDDAEFIMMGFMKGPVCRGQIALNVINDHFWVFFLAPDSPEIRAAQPLIVAEALDLRLPAEHESTAGLLAWRSYAGMEEKYLAARARLVDASGGALRPALSHLWDGGRQNPTAALTVFRHFDSASVLRGLAGERPQTALVLGYPLFERMHYLLLAGFDVYGNVGHQLATRLYMDFLRMEGELNFISFLPLAQRQPVLDQWYRGRSAMHDRFLGDARKYYPVETAVRYRSRESSAMLDELYRAAAARVAPLRDPRLDWWQDRRGPAALADPVRSQLQRISAVRGLPASRMPEQSVLLLRLADGSERVVSLVRNSAHSNIAYLFGEEKRRLPAEDTLLAIDGMVGAYPNLIFSVDAAQLPAFVEGVATLPDEAGLLRLVERFGVRRTDPRFWQVSDAILAAWRRQAPGEAAVLDYSRLDDL